MSSLGLHFIRFARYSQFSSVNPGFPERCIDNKEPALRKHDPSSLIIKFESPVHVRSRCNSYLFLLIAVPIN